MRSSLLVPPSSSVTSLASKPAFARPPFSANWNQSLQRTQSLLLTSSSPILIRLLQAYVVRYAHLPRDGRLTGERTIEEERPMATRIWRDEVLRLVRDEAAQLVEVLPPPEYEDEHIEGAISIPLKNMDSEADERLDRQRPVIVY